MWNNYIWSGIILKESMSIDCKRRYTSWAMKYNESNGIQYYKMLRIMLYHLPVRICCLRMDKMLMVHVERW